LGIVPDAHMTSQADSISAAIWRFEPGRTYELEGSAIETNIISMPVTSEYHHTYFGDGRRKWSGHHRAFHPNLVRAGEQPRGVFASSKRFSVLHVYLPHAMVEQLALESAKPAAGPSVALIDPMCAPAPGIEAICRQIMLEMANPDRCARMMLDALGQALAISLLRKHSNVSGSMAFVTESSRKSRDWRLTRAIDYLEAHLAEDVGLQGMAAEVGLSVTHLTTLFRDGTGEPPHRYLMRRRFERACELLGDPSISIGDIAYRCGFANSQHLAAVLRRRLSMTPTAYRRQLLS
jgi:AraC family transcriptional regulator